MLECHLRRRLRRRTVRNQYGPQLVFRFSNQFRENMSHLPFKGGLRYNANACVPGAQTERRGEATRPVRDLLTGESSPAGLLRGAGPAAEHGNRWILSSSVFTSSLACVRLQSLTYGSRIPNSSRASSWKRRTSASCSLSCFKASSFFCIHWTAFSYHLCASSLWSS